MSILFWFAAIASWPESTELVVSCKNSVFNTCFNWLIVIITPPHDPEIALCDWYDFLLLRMLACLKLLVLNKKFLLLAFNLDAYLLRWSSHKRTSKSILLLNDLIRRTIFINWMPGKIINTLKTTIATALL